MTTLAAGMAAISMADCRRRWASSPGIPVREPAQCLLRLGGGGRGGAGQCGVRGDRRGGSDSALLPSAACTIWRPQACTSAHWCSAAWVFCSASARFPAHRTDPAGQRCARRSYGRPVVLALARLHADARTERDRGRLRRRSACYWHRIHYALSLNTGLKRSLGDAGYNAVFTGTLRPPNAVRGSCRTATSIATPPRSQRPSC